MSTKHSLFVSRGWQPRAAARQRGITLIVVLILLVVVTILGIGGTRIALLSERSTRFDRDSQVAWQAAEAALVDAEYDIAGPNTSATQRLTTFTPENAEAFKASGCGTTDGLRGLCPTFATGAPIWETVDFMDDSNAAPTVALGAKTGFPFASGSTGVRPSRHPRYIIERAEATNYKGNATLLEHTAAAVKQPPVIYRITAMGFGPNAAVQVLMQSTFSRGVK